MTPVVGGTRRALSGGVVGAPCCYDNAKLVCLQKLNNLGRLPPLPSVTAVLKGKGKLLVFDLCAESKINSPLLTSRTPSQVVHVPRGKG